MQWGIRTIPLHSMWVNGTSVFVTETSVLCFTQALPGTTNTRGRLLQEIESVSFIFCERQKIKVPQTGSRIRGWLQDTRKMANRCNFKIGWSQTCFCINFQTHRELQEKSNPYGSDFFMAITQQLRQITECPKHLYFIIIIFFKWERDTI